LGLLDRVLKGRAPDFLTFSGHFALYQAGAVDWGT
jgi:hypothetical protein